MPRRGRRLIVFRHALLEALDARGDVAHHIGKAPLAEQQQDDHAENEPVPDAQTTHRKSPCAAHIGAAVSNCTRASPKTASRPALCVFAILYKIKLAHRRLDGEVDRIEQPPRAQIRGPRQVLAAREAEMLQDCVDRKSTRMNYSHY